MKKALTILTLVFTLGITFFMVSCSSSNVFTYVIDEAYTEYVTMGTSADYPPYEWPMNVDGKQTIVGIDIEIAKHIAKALGKNLKVVNKSFDYLLEDLQAGKVDFVIAGMTPTAEREEVVDFSIVYYEAVQVVLIQAEDAATFTTIEALNQPTLRVGAQMGSIQADLLADNFPNAQASILTLIPDLVLRLSQGQLDAVIVESPVAEGYLQNMSGLAISSISIGEPDGGSAVAVQSGNAALLASINAVLTQLIESGELAEIVSAAVLLNTPEATE
ncbi:MAG: transporter substrate-binding domain-containing protein [Bacillus subtilis]|nr:transporter substrate-binding domain-containing protein [Bacillus subtilis]